MNRRGYTLIEASVAMLIVAIMASAIFSVALTTKRASGKALHKQIADQGARDLSDLLKQYVTGDQSTSASINGIAVPGTAANSWGLTGKAWVNGTINDDCGGTTYNSPAGTYNGSAANCYAFKGVTHTVSGLMPAWFEGAPYNARVQYYVEPNSNYVVGVGSTPAVSITTQWLEN